MTACGTDYLTKNWFSRSYILVYSIFVYFLPLFTIIYSYWFIVQVSVIGDRQPNWISRSRKVIVAKNRFYFQQLFREEFHKFEIIVHISTKISCKQCAVLVNAKIFEI